MICVFLSVDICVSWCVCMCRGKRTTFEVGSLFPSWDSGTKLRWSDLPSKCPYLQSPVAGFTIVFHMLA